MVAESLPYGWQERSPKQVAAIVLLILMAMVLSFVELPVVPGAEWLKYDPSGIVSLLATILYGSWIGVAVAVTSWIPHLVTDPLGAFMNIMATVSLILVVGTVYRRKPCLMHAVLGCAAGVVVSWAVSICPNSWSRRCTWAPPTNRLLRWCCRHCCRSTWSRRWRTPS